MEDEDSSGSPLSTPMRIVPVLVPQRAKEELHAVRKCIDVRDGQVHCIKARLSTESVWANAIHEDGKACIAVNAQTPEDNEAVYNAKTPFHLISYTTGADTFYWGRYLCIGGKSEHVFDLQYVDEGEKSKFEKVPSKMRSKLESNYEKRFDELGYGAVYEPATFRLPTCEYTPDFYLPPPIHRWVEIKGPPPVESELQKCGTLAAMGFPVALFYDDPSRMSDQHSFTWEAGCSEPVRGLPSGCESLRTEDDGQVRLW